MKDVVFAYIVTLGCHKNFVDTEVIAAKLITSDIGITDDPDMASLYLINTCAFIKPARDEAEENIKIAIKWKKESPNKRKIVVSGCLTQWDREGEFKSEYPEVDLWLGVDQIKDIANIIRSLFERDTHIPAGRRIYNRYPNFIYDHLTPRVQLTPSHYAFIKIAEGCNNRCHYCSIPNIRGHLRSRRIESVVEEAKNLLYGGVKELIIIAQDITAFGSDRGENLLHLIRKLDDLDGDFWIRLHYLYPDRIDNSLIDFISGARHIVPYLDIPFQHVSDKILRAMGRRGTKRDISLLVEKLKAKIKNLVIRTTFLVGFPGEGDKEFEELVDFVKRYKIERFGVFKYSPEPNTPAFSLKGEPPLPIVEEREKILNNLYKDIEIRVNRECIGKFFKVLIDTIEDSYALGRTYMDSPEIDGVVRIDLNRDLFVGEFYNVEIKEYQQNSLIGKVKNLV